MMEVLQCCQNAGIMLSKDTFTIGKSVHFTGYNIYSNDVTLDSKKLEAIFHIPKLTDVNKLWTFLGLDNQLGMYIPDLAAQTSPLQSLLHCIFYQCSLEIQNLKEEEYVLFFSEEFQFMNGLSCGFIPN